MSWIYDKRFTLIELIASIVVIGILAAIVVPNISNIKKDSEKVAVNSNERTIQAAVDLYYIRNDKLPTLELLNLQEPQPVSFNELQPNYIRDIPKDKNFYWIDVNGEVWASEVDSPTGVYYSISSLVWNTVDGAKGYNIYKTTSESSSSASRKNLEFVEYVPFKEIDSMNHEIDSLPNGEMYLVSSIDKHGHESPPVGPAYKGYYYYKNVILSPPKEVFTFTNAGVTGRFGPSQEDLNHAYSGTNLEGNVTSDEGIQLWTVPETGIYRIETYGGQGGDVGTYVGGRGAYMSGTFFLEEGDILKILVGQTGDIRSGGGGTFVATIDNEPLIVSGGGGGAGNHSNGHNATTETFGGDSETGEKGGRDGHGANDNDRFNGGGFYTDGRDESSIRSGKAFVNGGAGGLNANRIHGSFGGGSSGGVNYTSGGGGGYSGGAPSDANPSHAAGGGGSYNSGEDQINIAGINFGSGKVVISLFE